MSRSFVRLALLAAASLATGACGPGDDASPDRPTAPGSAVPISAPPVADPTAPAPTPTTQPAGTPATPTQSADATAPTTLPPAPSPADVWFIVVDDTGVTRDGKLVVHGPVVWADDDEMGGIVYLPAGDDTTIRWLPAGADQPVDTGLRYGLVGTTETGPALVTAHDPPAGTECDEIISDGEVHAVNARPLDASAGLSPPQVITCHDEGADDWYAVASYRSGHLLQVHSYAAAWKYTDDEIVLIGPDGEQIELPATAFAGWVGWFEQQRELDGELSPDANLIAVRQRLDNRYSNGPDPETNEVDVEEWERLTAAIPSTIRVVERAAGTIHYETQVPYGVELGDFDGRHLVLIEGAKSTIVDTLGETPPTMVPGAVVLTRPTADSPGTVLPAATPMTVRRGDAGTWVSHLQLRLVVHDPSAGLSVDGRFGPARRCGHGVPTPARSRTRRHRRTEHLGRAAERPRRAAEHTGRTTGRCRR